jgi:hypothetical protein
MVSAKDPLNSAFLDSPTPSTVLRITHHAADWTLVYHLALPSRPLAMRSRREVERCFAIAPTRHGRSGVESVVL